MPEHHKVHLFTGEDTFLIEEAIINIRKSLDGDTLMNFYSFSHDDSGAVDQAMELLNTIPFFDEKRLVVIRNVHKLDARSFEKIVTYLSDPSDSAILILTIEGKKPWGQKEKKPWEEKYRKISVGAHVQTYNEMKDNQLIQWIVSRARSMGNTIEPVAANLLKEATLSQTWQIASELEKLSLFCGERKNIRKEDVEKIVLRNYDDKIFKLTDSLFEKKRDTLFIIREIEASGINELEVISALINLAIDHFHVLFSPASKRKNLHSFVEGKIISHWKLWKADELHSLASALAGVERGIKSGRCLSGFSEITEIAARYITHTASS
jgi:DNA polymerase III subunit delta